MKKHIIIATYDGIGTYYSGVGTIAKNIIDSLTILSDKLDIKVSIAYINVDKKSEVFNKECFDSANNLTTKTGGKMIPLCNTTKGQSEWDMWRSFDEWRFACASLVTALNLTLDEKDENIIILNDTPFLFFSGYKDLVSDKNLKCFYFPLSTGENHAFGNEEWRNNRIKAENGFFKMIQTDPNSKVISLGEKFAERMNQDYGLTFEENDYLQNGLCFDKYENFLDNKFSNQDLQKYGVKIEEDKKIIFAWGRCSIAKGFKELALAWVKAHKLLPNHYLLLQIPNNSGETDYFNEVKGILENIPRVIILNDFNPDIWKTVLRNKNTDVVCIPSLMDPFPHTSIEAKLFSKDMNFITIISDVDGAVDAFKEDECIYVDPKDIKTFADKIIEVINLDNSQKREMIDKNIQTIQNFNFPKILEKFINLNLFEN
ncbi:glycosyltransferase [Patescibacteria group bacterium]|nr:glycosyltransferase [Patescibacteria group bacterium]